jgi:DNA-binding Lrp family transcriptional regulator
MIMSLKAQDILVVLKLALSQQGLSYAELAAQLGISASEAHAAVRRAQQAGFLREDGRKVQRSALLEFIVHGLKYVFAPERGPITRGMPTAYAAPPLSELISGNNDLPPVWPDPHGTVRGETLRPLYKSIPDAARRDEKLYQALSLIDAIRAGRARERALAEKHLREMLQS